LKQQPFSHDSGDSNSNTSAFSEIRPTDRSQQYIRSNPKNNKKYSQVEYKLAAPMAVPMTRWARDKRILANPKSWQDRPLGIFYKLSSARLIWIRHAIAIRIPVIDPGFRRLGLECSGAAKPTGRIIGCLR
jgi:hypothetical protein